MCDISSSGPKQNETKFFKIYGLSGNYIKKKYFSPSYNWDISLKSSNLDKSTVPPVIKQHTFLPLISLENLSNTDTDSAPDGSTTMP